jgi:hypothetical protein
VGNRLTPFEIRTLLFLRSTVSLEIPPGFTAQIPTSFSPRLDQRFVVCTNNWTLEGKTLIARFECRQPAGEFEPSDYAEFRDTMAHTLSLLEREVVFEVTGGSGQ